MDCKYERVFIVSSVWEQYYNNARVLLLSLFYKILSSKILAQAPNITGEIGGVKWGVTHYSGYWGALYETPEVLPYYINSVQGDTSGLKIGINAYNSNSIYSGTTIRPESYSCLFYIKY